jgi:hypothetical protein
MHDDVKVPAIFLPSPLFNVQVICTLCAVLLLLTTPFTYAESGQSVATASVVELVSISSEGEVAQSPTAPKPIVTVTQEVTPTGEPFKKILVEYE